MVFSIDHSNLSGFSTDHFHVKILRWFEAFIYFCQANAKLAASFNFLSFQVFLFHTDYIKIS